MWRARVRWSVLYRLIPVILSFIALIVTLYPDLIKPTSWKIVLGIVSVLLLLVFLYLEWQSSPPKILIPIDDKRQIQDYMHNWISTGGHVVIFTRDLSWAQDKDRSIKKLLVEKAKKKELSICLPNPTSLTDELESAGARICAYSHIDHVPQSRFTIVNFGREGSMVAVGHRQGKYHAINEFSASDHPAFYLAQDLAQLAIKASSSGMETRDRA